MIEAKQTQAEAITNKLIVLKMGAPCTLQCPLTLLKEYIPRPENQGNFFI